MLAPRRQIKASMAADLATPAAGASILSATSYDMMHSPDSIIDGDGSFNYHELSRVIDAEDVLQIPPKPQVLSGWRQLQGCGLC